MNILFLSAIFPYPLYSGGQVRVYNLLKRLSKKHQITLISFIRSPQEQYLKQHVPFLHRVETVYRGRAWQAKYIFRACTSRYPFLYSTYVNAEAARMVNSVITEEKIDLIHAEPGYVFSSLPQSDIPVVIAEHNIEHQIYQGYVDRFSIVPLKPLLQFDVEKLKKIEQETWKRSSNVVVVSAEDGMVVKKMTGIRPGIVPNGVDIDFFSYLPKQIKKNECKVLFVGSFRWMQNVDAVKRLIKEIWPDIVTKYPYAKLDIVGKSFPSSLRALLTSGTTVHSNVDDIRLSYQAADVLLAPIEIGGGTKYKILEAMACGLPVITTKKGIEGMPLSENEEVFIVKNENDYSSVLEKIMNDKKLRQKIITNARKKVEILYSWKTIAEELDDIWKKSV